MRIICLPRLFDTAPARRTPAVRRRRAGAGARQPL